MRRELEKADAAELADLRLTREVKEFFQDATRTAADIVSKIAELQEAAATEKISEEMHEFLVDAIGRMESFVEHLDKDGGVNEENLEPHMHNLVGPMLDSFRLEGTAKLADQHIGQDPFAEEVKEPKAESESTTERSQRRPDDFELLTEATEPAPEVKKVRSLGETRDGPSTALDLSPERVIDAGESPADEKHPPSSDRGE